MKDNFDKCLEFVLDIEGGFSDNPKDPGGPTFNGITQRTFNAAVAQNKWPPRALSSATGLSDTWKSQRDQIYRDQYWDSIKGDDLPAGVDLVLFDGSVNSGASQSVKFLQKALGVTTDGQIGQMTLAALSAILYPRLIEKICEARRDFLRANKNFSTFGKGWMARVDHLQSTAIAMGNGSAPISVLATTADQQAKAAVSDAVKAPSKVIGAALAGAGSTVLSIASIAPTAINAIQEPLQPFADNPHIAKVLLWCAVIGALCAVGGILQALWAKGRQDQINDVLSLTPTPERIV